MNNNEKVLTNILKNNNGYITSKEVTQKGIHRMYLSKLVKEEKIEKVDNGIYMDVDQLVDKYYVLKLKYSKLIFSGFTALYFHGLTEVFPYEFNVTVYRDYHSKKIESKYFVTRVSNDFYELGKIKVLTPFGNEVYAYDKERCICDIIAHRDQLDFEQVKKSVKLYLKDKDKDYTKLNKYAMNLKVYDEVMEFIGLLHE